MASKKFRKYANNYNSGQRSQDPQHPSVLPSEVLLEKDEFEPSRRLDKNPAGFFAFFNHKEFPYQDFTILIVEHVTVDGANFDHAIYVWFQCGTMCFPFEYDYKNNDPSSDQKYWRDYTFESKHVLGIRVLQSQNKAQAVSEADMSNLYYYMQANNLAPYLWTASGTTVNKNVAIGDYDNIFAYLPSVSGSHRKAKYRTIQRAMYSLAAEKIPTSFAEVPVPLEDPNELQLLTQQPAVPEEPTEDPPEQGMLTYGQQISAASIFEWYSGQFPDTTNAHMVFFDGRSFYVPNGTGIHQTLSRILKPAGYLVCFATYDLAKIGPLLIPSKHVVAYGKFPDYPLPDPEMAKQLASQQWYNLTLNLWGRGEFMENAGFVGVVRTKDQLTQIGSFAGSLQDIFPFLKALQNLLGGGS